MSNKLERRKYILPAKYIFKSCNFCGSETFSRLCEENGFKIVKCSQCGLVMVNPAPPADYLLNFYNQYHEPNSSARWGSYMFAIYKAILKKIENLPMESRILDVGCGYGHFLKLVKDRNFDAYGIEIADEPANYAERNYGIPIFRGFLEDAPFEKNFFDVITLWFVLEHVSDPHSVIDICYRLLKKGGLLIMCVPNFDFRQILVLFKNFTLLEKLLNIIGIQAGTVNIFNVIDPPAHLFGFNKQSLQFLLKKVGYGQIQFDIPADINHSTMMPTITEVALNLNAKFIKFLTSSKIIISNSLLIIATK